jgi:hypothetical protein
MSACVLGGCGASGGIDSRAVAVTDKFTTLAFDDHNCRAASRYASNPQFCASLRAGGMIPGWSRFPLASHRIARTGCRLGHLPEHRQSLVAGCVEYTASSGLRIQYGMTHGQQGWRVVEIGVSGSSSRSHVARLDRSAVAVADAFTRLAWNTHDCRAGRRYLLPGFVGGACANPTVTFPLQSHRIRPHRCGHGDWNGGYRISPGCVVYTASNGETLEYDLTRTPQGWRIIETVGVS